MSETIRPPVAVALEAMTPLDRSIEMLQAIRKRTDDPLIRVGLDAAISGIITGIAILEQIEGVKLKEGKVREQ